MAETDCPAPGDFIARARELIATQYRESTRLLAYLSAVLGQLEEAARAVCAIPGYFELDTAIGHQLTLLGKRLGWPREHCVCVVTPVFGFVCEDAPPSQIPIVGFCEGGSWIDCQDVGQGLLRIDDDEVYRAMLKARRYQMLGLYDVASLQAALKHVFGPAAAVHDDRPGRVILAPGRDLSAEEMTRLPVTLRVLPVAPGIRIAVQFGSAPIFGFGEGWAGFCEGAQWACPIEIDPYDCA